LGSAKNDRLLVRRELKPGYTEIVGRDYPHLELVSFGIITLEAAKTFEDNTGDDEVALVLLSGAARISAKGLDPHRDLRRRSVFLDKPWGVYLPRKTTFGLEALEPVSIARANCPTDQDHPVALVSPDQIPELSVGAHNWRRRIFNIIGPAVAASHLVVGETINPPGNWSSWPPHRHDHDNPPFESDMEETYYYKVNPVGGFGLQRVYNDDRTLDEVLVVQEGDLVALPEGYHPVVAAAGYELYYLWVLAGKGRVLRPYSDPAYAWVASSEPIVREITR